MQTLDQMIAIPYRKLLNALCFVTGKNNYYLAKAAIVVALVLCAAYTVIARNWLHGFLAVFMLLMLPLEFRKINDLQSRAQQSGDILPMLYLERERWAWLRVLLTILATLDASLILSETPIILRCGFLLSLTASEYFRYENNPGGKHIFRRAFDWLVDHKPNFQLLPAPRPEIA